MRVRDAMKKRAEGVTEEKHAWRSAKNATPVPPPVKQMEPVPVQKKKVLFVCIGNACRSQMAEAFATRYGSDILDVSSVGLAPANGLPDLTKAVMKDKGISLDTQFSKGFEMFPQWQWDVVVNMSDRKLPYSLQSERVIDWKVEDPMGQRQIVHERVRDEIENLVMRLILELRTPPKRP
jgi:arsenate reductase (thioredoxin)